MTTDPLEPAASPDPREPLGRVFHEQGRLTVNAERRVPFALADWPDRSGEQKEIDMRGASAVARQAVEDAQVEVDQARAAVLAAVAERDRVIAALERRADRAIPGVERDTWLAAAAIVKEQP